MDLPPDGARIAVMETFELLYLQALTYFATLTFLYPTLKKKIHIIMDGAD